MFSKRLAELRKAKNMTQNDFAKAFNIATGTIGMWESGKREPNYEMIQKIADFFDVTVDYLLGREDKKSDDTNMDDLQYALYGETKELSEEDKKKILDFAKFVKEQNKNK